MIGNIIINKIGNWKSVKGLAVSTLKSHKMHVLDSVTKNDTHAIYFYYPWYKHLAVKCIKKNINAIDYDNYASEIGELLEDWYRHYCENQPSQDLQLISLIDVINSELERRSK